jgi:hypothetical protein
MGNTLAYFAPPSSEKKFCSNDARREKLRNRVRETLKLVTKTFSLKIRPGTMSQNFLA